MTTPCRRTLRLAPLLALAPLLLGGCATLFTGTHDTLTFDANAPGVRLTIDGQYRGELPLTIDMSRNFMGGRQFVARFEAPGYATQEFALERAFNPVAILDVSSTLVSGGVDVLTGSLMKFSPREYHVQMVPEGQAADAPAARRSAELHRFALNGFRDLQKDLARGGGESLSTFAAMVGGDDATARRVVEASVRGAPGLLAAPTAPVFVHRFDALLAASPELAGCRL
ncbi:conserved hypothetical protein [Anaeromyxobacter sp. K]|uniref:hypothetical protein n=1 Tax=Anaeromyxobacter sp. (strain K) TaxID=447217 RepID=UPI00015F8B2B|nr:hypothetical protein [Anaeromyxobacter sp. K]ACG74246.1 conserved hypothetical protein [Anaeromyxobacter sp. K]